MSDILASRTVSAFPLSIGTCLAMESVSDKGGAPYDPERKIPNMIDLNKYDQFWINISTLFRNLIGAVHSEAISKLTPQACSQALLEEMNQIESIVRSESLLTQVTWFGSNYERLIPLSSKAELRAVTTDKQKFRHNLQNKTLQIVVNARNTENRPIRLFANKLLPVKRHKALLLTHMAYDLINWEKFHTLDLLESHTGILKQRDLWYTKLYGGDELICIPFSERMLKFFGDHSLFKPFPKKARDTVLELAKEKKWLWSTNDTKVKIDLRSLRDHLLRNTLLSL